MPKIKAVKLSGHIGMQQVLWHPKVRRYGMQSVSLCTTGFSGLRSGCL